MLKTRLDIVIQYLQLYLFMFHYTICKKLIFMCIYEDNTCLGSTQKTNTNNLGCILLKGRKKFRTKFWKWHHAVLK